MDRNIVGILVRANNGSPQRYKKHEVKEKNRFIRWFRRKQFRMQCRRMMLWNHIRGGQ